MKISRAALQSYFTDPLPSVADIADAFTFHSFEIDSTEGDVLDVKVLPNRAFDCANEAGLARELSAIIDIPLRESPETGKTNVLTVALSRINGILGSSFTGAEVRDVCRRLSIGVVKEAGDTITLAIPAFRPDLALPEDIAEEVGRLLGYDRIEGIPLPPSHLPVEESRFCGAERMKDELAAQGFIEVSTRSFAQKGDVYLANPMDKTKPALRTSLAPDLSEALVRARLQAPLVLGPGEKPKLFEIGTVFPKEGEHVELRMTEAVPAWGKDASVADNLSVARLEAYGKDYQPKRYRLGSYRPFSAYPFITRDVAVWTSSETKEETVEELIRASAGDLAVRMDCFDRFEKEGKRSYAFRIVFQSMERTLTDEEVHTYMDAVHEALSAASYEVR